MQFPLSFLDMTIWLAVMSIILIITAEFLSSYHGQVNLLINRNRLTRVSLVVGVLFILTAIIHVLLSL
jgi:preprotein translocase subunit SecG